MGGMNAMDDPRGTLIGTQLVRVASMCGGRLENAADPSALVAPGAVSIDTRVLGTGAIFVAVRGEERDGHDFVAAAAAAGALGAIVEEGRALDVPQGFALIRVADPVAGLQNWASAHRAAMGARVVVVTGSSGKTTTKDRLASMLAIDGPVHATPGNLNNHLGVPITLLGLTAAHRWAVVEIAMNHPGEIAPLSRLARPHHVVITTIGWAHIGAFGTREAILAEKLDALAGLEPGGTLFHAADPWTIARLPDHARALRRLTFGLEPGADFFPERVEYHLTETLFDSPYTGSVRYACPGRGALHAAAAACLVARTLGIPGEKVRGALELARPRPLRMEPRPLGPATAILDCYNASPESSLLAIEFVQSIACTGRRWLAFGEMRELGDRTEEAHRRIGESAAGFDGAFFLGHGSAPALEAYGKRAGSGRPARLYTGSAEMAADLAERLGEGDVILFKGSRWSAMERVYEECMALCAARGE
jgi:UDP-N-acetylmuramoyl-tripeptide--D-alanyl-D-alanine ligase